MVSRPYESPRPGVSITKIFSFVSSPNQLAIIPLVSKVIEVRLDEGAKMSFVFIPVIVLHEALLPVPVPPITHTDLNYIKLVLYFCDLHVEQYVFNLIWHGYH